MNERENTDTTRPLVSQRVLRAQRDVQEAEKQDPLRRRLLELLASSERQPSELAQLVGANRESVSRALSKLREQGLVEWHPVLGDSRLREYMLSAEGRRQLSRHQAFGYRPSSPAELDRLQAVAFLEAALESAVAMRRSSNRLDEAVTRMKMILEQAQRIDACALVVECTAELATTLRQNRSLDEIKVHLDALERIELGQEHGFDASLAIPAAAHRHYVLGRLAVRNDLERRAEYLITATQLFEGLALARGDDRWRLRQAWSLASLASNHREQSHYERAIKRTLEALPHFVALNDDYGQSRCYFMFGFCLRLLGSFDAAWSCLVKAHDIAAEHGYMRFVADSLMQMGEVRRCQNNIDGARTLLSQALHEADALQMHVTRAFSLSALGALHYQDGELSEAQTCLHESKRLFEKCSHDEGWALNARRLAAVERAAASKAGHRTSQTALALARGAQSSYVNLGSPAGVLACEIEIARGSSSETNSESVESLLRRLNSFMKHDHELKDLLELDPWVPRVLSGFAFQARSEPLQELSRELLDATRRCLAERVERCFSGQSQIPVRLGGFGLDGTDAEWGSHEVLPVDEMGGEPRWYPVAAQLLAV